MQRIVIQKSGEIHCSWIAYGEIAGVFVTGECELFKILQIGGIRNNAHGSDNLEITIIEQPQWQSEMYLVMTGFMCFESYTAVVGDTAAFDIKH